jgi:hypothetical protein
MKPSVPFAIARGEFLGWAETQGIVSFDGANVKIEFRTADTVVGALKSKLHEISLPVDGINAIELRERRLLFGRRHYLFIKVAEMGAASEIPTFKMGELLLPITDARAAVELASAVRVAAELNKGAS